VCSLCYVLGAPISTPARLVQNAYVPINVVVRRRTRIERRTQPEVLESWRASLIVDEALQEMDYCLSWSRRLSEITYRCEHGIRTDPFDELADYTFPYCDACAGFMVADTAKGHKILLFDAEDEDNPRFFHLDKDNPRFHLDRELIDSRKLRARPGSPRLKTLPRPATEKSGKMFEYLSDAEKRLRISPYDPHLRNLRALGVDADWPNGYEAKGNTARKAPLGWGNFADSDTGFEGFRSFRKYTPDVEVDADLDFEDLTEAPTMSTCDVSRAMSLPIVHMKSIPEHRSIIIADDKRSYSRTRTPGAEWKESGSIDIEQTVQKKDTKRMYPEIMQWWLGDPPAQKIRQGSPWPFTVPAETCTNDEIDYWRRIHWFRSKKYIRPGRHGWGVEGSWDDEGAVRVKGWRTERKMCDLDARLNVNKYGGGFNPGAMIAQAGLENYRAALFNLDIEVNRHHRKLGRQAPPRQYRDTVRTPFERVGGSRHVLHITTKVSTASGRSIGLNSLSLIRAGCAAGRSLRTGFFIRSDL
jgi:hypothetical protein